LIMRAYAIDHGTTYQAESITIKNYGDGGDVRQAAVVVALSAAGEGREGGFVGRDELIATVLARLDPAQSAVGSAVFVLSGLPGVGKTALARHVAALALGRDWFTAAVFADFHGYDPDPHARVALAQLFGSLLRTLDVDPDQIPVSVNEQAAVYHRTLSALAKDGQRVLLLFDNVSSPEQVNDLLPESKAHRVLITSRNTLGEISNVRIIELSTLPLDEAKEVLAEVLRERDPADSRISQNPAEAGKLAELCGRLPLALRISGALLAEDPAMPIASLVEDLGVAKTRLEGLVYGELAVSAAFDLSWRQLLERNEPAARLFVELPGNPGPEISSGAAAALIDESDSDTQRLLRVLRRCHLIESATTANRWHMHDLLQLYADKRRQSDTSHDHKAAVDRLLRYYLARATGGSDRLLGLPPSSGPAFFADRDEALAWLDDERPNLTASVLLARRAAGTEPRSTWPWPSPHSCG
jgi:AAA ATPase domain